MQKPRIILIYALAAAAIFLVARGLGWYANRKAVVHLQRQVIERVEELAGYAYYDFQILNAGQSTEKIADLDDPELSRHWLSGWFGIEWFHDLEYVTFAQFDGVPGDGGQAAPRSEISDQQILPLLKLKTIKWWALSGTAVTNECVAKIVDDLQPERMWLGQTQISDNCLEVLSGCDSLRYLAIEATATTDKGLEALSRLPNLRSLSLGSPFYTAKGIRTLGSLKSLESLYLDRLPVASAMQDIASLKGLKTLSLRGTGIGDKELLLLAGLTDLEVLQVDSTLVGDSGMQAAQEWKNLRELTAQRTLLSDAGLEHLAECEQLERLEISGSASTLPGVIKLLQQEQGRTLEESLGVVFETEVSDNGKLLSLDLSPVRISDEHVELLKPLQDLQWLKMPNNRLSQTGVEALVNLRFARLQLLNIDGAQIGDAALSVLSKLDSLRNLHVVGTSVTAEAVQSLRNEKPTLQVYLKPVRKRIVANNTHE
ncbi:MAG: hypothetical protein VXZ82_23480 [Planctomycetota bacterium]|nr:hypothetical protein [Planctomycetota bacterium]